MRWTRLGHARDLLSCFQTCRLDILLISSGVAVCEKATDGVICTRHSSEHFLPPPEENVQKNHSEWWKQNKTRHGWRRGATHTQQMSAWKDTEIRGLLVIRGDTGVNVREIKSCDFQSRISTSCLLHAPPRWHFSSCRESIWPAQTPKKVQKQFSRLHAWNGKDWQIDSSSAFGGRLLLLVEDFCFWWKTSAFGGRLLLLVEDFCFWWKTSAFGGRLLLLAEDFCFLQKQKCLQGTIAVYVSLVLLHLFAGHVLF